jgi:hypothetical protein
LLVIGIPAGLENFFEELGVPVADERNFTPPPPNRYDIDKIVDISKHGIIYSPALEEQS